MNATQKLLDKWIAWRSLKPGADLRVVAIGAELGVKHTSIGNYRSGFSQAAPHVIEKMARDLGENPMAWVALVESERARDAEDRKTWARLARQMGLAASLLLVLATPALTSQKSADTAYYVRRRSWLRTVLDLPRMVLHTVLDPPSMVTPALRLLGWNRGHDRAPAVLA